MADGDTRLGHLASSPGYYLLTIRDDGSASLDGAHSTPAGVAKAAHLYSALGLSRRDVRAVMVHVSAAPEPSAEGVNHEAVAELNAIGLR